MASKPGVYITHLSRKHELGALYLTLEQEKHYLSCYCNVLLDCRINYMLANLSIYFNHDVCYPS